MQGDVDQAEKEIRAAIQADPKTLAPHLALIQLLMRRNQWDPAIQAGQAALAVDANAPAVHNLIGASYQGKKDAQRAEEEFRKALKADAKFVPALLNLGSLAFQAKKLEEAEQHFRAASETAPTDLTALFSLASVLVMQDKQPEAILRLEAASTLSPGLLILQLTLADLYLKTGRLNEAQAMTQRLLAANPKLGTGFDDPGDDGLLADEPGGGGGLIPQGDRGRAEIAARLVHAGANAALPEQADRGDGQPEEGQGFGPRQADGADRAGGAPGGARIRRKPMKRSRRNSRPCSSSIPDNPNIRTQLGAMLMARGKTDEAEAEFRDDPQGQPPVPGRPPQHGSDSR